MMKALSVLSALIVVLLYSLPITAADAAAGKEVYTKKCATCHADNGDGKEAIAKMFQVTMKPLSSKEIQSKSDGDMKKVILEGTGKMKPVKDVDAKAADDIVAYV